MDQRDVAGHRHPGAVAGLPPHGGDEVPGRRAPHQLIFNGLLQSLVGLDDYRDFTGDPRGTTLFRAGHGNAKAIVPLSDPGSWPRYSLGGPESTLEYHTLLRDILGSLCHRQGSPVYYDTEARFTRHLAARPG